MEILLALIPIISIVLFLFVFNVSSQFVGIISFFITIFIVLIFFPKTSFIEISFASFHGVLISLVIIYVLFFGVLLFHLLSDIGFIEEISDFVAKTTTDRTRQVIILAIAFSPLIESVSGFGIAIIVIAPILVALGIDRYKAALISLVSLSAVPWGALATGTVIGSNLSSISLKTIGLGSAILCIPTFLFFAFVAVYFAAGKDGIINNWFEIVTVSISLAVGVIVSNIWFSVELAGVISAIFAFLTEGIFIFFSKKDKNKEPSPITITLKENISILKMLIPYFVLTILLIVTRTIPNIEKFLTSFGVITWARYSYSLPVFYSPGFFLFLTCIFTVFFFKLNWGSVKNAIYITTKQLIPVTITTITFIALAQIMAEANMMNVLAEGIGTVVGSYFFWISPLIGAFSGMITGSNAASNAMFIELQTMTASKYQLSTSLIASIQNTAASHMTMASPSRVLLAATMTNHLEKEQKLFKTMFLIVMLALVLMMIFGYFWNAFIS